MMAEKAVEPRLPLSVSLDAAVPPCHLVRRVADALDLNVRTWPHSVIPQRDGPTIGGSEWFCSSGRSSGFLQHQQRASPL